MTLVGMTAEKLEAIADALDLGDRAILRYAEVVASSPEVPEHVRADARNVVAEYGNCDCAEMQAELRAWAAEVNQ